MKEDFKIGIVSLGLIGGSILKSLSIRGFRDVFVVTQNAETAEMVREYTKNIFKDLNSLKGCRMVFVCSPISKTLELLEELEEIVSKDTIVADVSSVKEFVMLKERPYKFIGSHPMAGSEFSGFTASSENLFEKAIWAMTPAKNVSKKELKTFKAIVEAMGAQPFLTTAKEHDEAVAKISHFPMIVAQALFDSVKDDRTALKLASSGFRDMTRLAMSNSQMATDMLKFNEANIQQASSEFKKSYDNLIKKDYKEKIEKLSTQRAKMYSEMQSSGGKNIL